MVAGECACTTSPPRQDVGRHSDFVPGTFKIPLMSSMMWPTMLAVSAAIVSPTALDATHIQALTRATLSAGDQCTVDNLSKQDCGIVGPTQQTCEASGCCWQPRLSDVGDVPWYEHLPRTYADPGALGLRQVLLEAERGRADDRRGGRRCGDMAVRLHQPCDLRFVGIGA